VTTNIDTNTELKDCRLIVDQSESFRSCTWEMEEFGIKIDEARKQYFYPEGPEFRIEYIHERVED
jgi:hypothetical protein